MCSSVLTVAQGANSYSYEDKPRVLKGSLGYREGVAELGCEARPACLLVRFGGHRLLCPFSSLASLSLSLGTAFPAFPAFQKLP